MRPFSTQVSFTGDITKPLSQNLFFITRSQIFSVRLKAALGDSKNNVRTERTRDHRREYAPHNEFTVYFFLLERTGEPGEEGT